MWQLLHIGGEQLLSAPKLSGCKAHQHQSHVCYTFLIIVELEWLAKCVRLLPFWRTSRRKTALRCSVFDFRLRLPLSSDDTSRWPTDTTTAHMYIDVYIRQEQFSWLQLKCSSAELSFYFETSTSWMECSTLTAPAERELSCLGFLF